MNLSDASRSTAEKTASASGDRSADTSSEREVVASNEQTAYSPSDRTAHTSLESTTSGKSDAKRSAEKSAEQKARDRVAQIKSFYTHLAVFLAVHTALVGIYLLSGGGHFWPLYSFFGWGIGLASHAASTFDMMGMYGRTWEERKVREIMLQQEHGLNADEVRTLLKREFEHKALPSADELDRMRQRLENLEAIVTSRDWDELPSHSGPLRRGDLEGAEDVPREDTLSDDPSKRAAQLAKRVR